MLNRKFPAVIAAACGVALLAGTTVPAMAQPAAPKGPKNVIVMIGDGMGYNQIAEASLWQNGTSYRQVVGTPGNVTEVLGTPSQVFETWPTQIDMATYAINGSYDPQAAWTDFDYVKHNPTDSSAAGTAMASGIKTYNGAIGVDVDGNPVQNLSEYALEMGKSAGSISSVQYSHATPAAYYAHDVNRNNYVGIANDGVWNEMTVIMGAGHPWYTDGGELKATPSYRYIGEADYNALVDGSAGYDFVESKADFDALTTGETPDRVFGIAQAATTLQQGRPGDSAEVGPFEVPMNANVPDLATMTKGALNVLDNNPNGFTLMVEGGAIDWAGHANQNTRNIEETIDFFNSIEAVVDWVETNSSWKETLVIGTADHETGYLEGPSSNPDWTLLSGAAGELPAKTWHSGDHTNQLVPVYAIGAGSKELARMANDIDPVRGAYIDNTELATLLLNHLWASGPGTSAGKSQFR